MTPPLRETEEEVVKQPLVRCLGLFVTLSEKVHIVARQRPISEYVTKTLFVAYYQRVIDCALL